jgi:hypothetical protein
VLGVKGVGLFAMSAAPEEPELEPDESPLQGDDAVDEQEEESFPASDPHSDWAGTDPDPVRE